MRKMTTPPNCSIRRKKINLVLRSHSKPLNVIFIFYYLYYIERVRCWLYKHTPQKSHFIWTKYKNLCKSMDKKVNSLIQPPSM